MQEANLKRVHIVLFQPYDILQKANLWRLWKDQWVPGVAGREGWIGRGWEFLGSETILHDINMMDTWH